MVYECQACFTLFSEDDQTPLDRWRHECPSCGDTYLKRISPKEDEELVPQVMTLETYHLLIDKGIR